MILILSFDGDRSTNRLIDWLIHLNCPYIRIHLEDEDFRKIKIASDGKFSTIFFTTNDGLEIDFSKIKFIYNRGRKFILPKIRNKTKLPKQVFENYLSEEFNTLTHYFYESLNKISIGCFQLEQHSKLNQLKYASEVNLKIPQFCICNNSKDVISLFKNNEFITKAIYENIAQRFDGYLYVQRVQNKSGDDLPSGFFPSFFQKKIIKEFEIRTYYLDDKFYTIRFFSNSTTIDMRDNYHISKFEAFKLPLKIEISISKLMKKLNLYSGSIDLIKSTDGNYYFIEVNPNGQYDWVSQFGGYSLDKEIAIYLKSK